MTEPRSHNGWRKADAPKVADHHGSGLNAAIAKVLTRGVFTMWAFWVFNGIALVSLPTAIKTGNPTVLVNWVSSNWIQLVLLPALGVGQKLQDRAADARGNHMAHGIDVVLDRLDERTAGGIKAILDRLPERQ